MAKPPAFQFYVADYLASSHVQAMSLAAQGAYIRLLCYQWQDGFISPRVQDLARLCNLSVSNFEKLWTQVRPCFDVRESDGNLINLKLESVRAQQIAYREKQSEHGKSGGRPKGSERVAFSEKKGNESSSSSTSPSSSTTTTEKGTKYIPPLAVDADFERLWNDYPVKDGKREAQRHFKATVKGSDGLSSITTALGKYLEHLRLHPTKIPKNGSTWFNNWRDWENWVEPANGNGAKQQFTQQQLDAEVQKLRDMGAIR